MNGALFVFERGGLMLERDELLICFVLEKKLRERVFCCCSEFWEKVANLGEFAISAMET